MKRIRRPITKQVTVTLVIAGILATCRASAAANAGSAGRILHFPGDRSLGKLCICDASIQREVKSFYYFSDGMRWEYLGEAKGAVAVPAGKRLMLKLNKASGNNLSALAQLGANDLYELHLGEAADYCCLPHLASLTGLKELHFARALSPKARFPVFTSYSLEQLKALRSLELLTAPDQLTDTGLNILADALPQLRALHISRNQLTDRGLSALAKFTALEELSLGGDKITGRGLASLAKLPSLYCLSLWGSYIRDDAMLQVRKIPSLKILYLGHLKITDTGLAHLAGHPTLENLSLYNTKVTDRGLVHLKSLPSLKALNLRKPDSDYKNPPVTDAGTVHLKAIKSLEHLELSAIRLSDAGLANLAELVNLKRLDLAGASAFNPNPYSEKGLKDLTRISSLESLTVGGPGVTDAALSQIARMTNLRHLVLSFGPISDEGLGKLVTLRSLKTLSVRTKSRVTFSGVNRLNDLSELSALLVYDVTKDDTPLNIMNLTKLKTLILAPGKGGTFRDEDLACLANLKQLKSLQLGGMKLAITDAGMAHLGGLTSLDCLILGGRGVTDCGLASLANMPKLYLLKIGGCFTDGALQQLEDHKALTSVWIYSANKFSTEAKEHFRQNMPNLYFLTAEQDRALGRPGNTGSGQSAHPKPGSRAPDFTVTTLDGKQFTLSQQRGKVVLLHFWATWCAPCVKSLPAMKRFHDRMKRKYGDRVVLLDLVMDDVDPKLRGLIEIHKLTTPQARIGQQSDVASAYGVTGAPDDFMIGPDGRILLNRESPERSGDTEAFIDRALASASGARAAR